MMDNQNLIEKIRKILEDRDHDKEEGKLFNFFDALSIREREVIHSRVVATLLSPTATHGMKDLPYRLFKKKLFREFLGLKPDGHENDNESIEISNEYYIGPIPNDYESGGNIDILIRTDTMSIAIENKIYAVDQPKQLYRYAKWLHEDLESKKGTAFLIYLTLDGHKPSVGSVTGKDGTVVELGENNQSSYPFYVRLSYRFIIEWIQDIMRELLKSDPDNNSPRYIFLQQYKKAVESMINKEDNEMEKITKAINGHFKEAEQIAKAFPVARSKAIRDMMVRAFDELKLAEDTFTSFAEGYAPSSKPCRIWSSKEDKMAVGIAWFGKDPYAKPTIGIAFSEEKTNKNERLYLLERIQKIQSPGGLRVNGWEKDETEWWPVHFKSAETVSGAFLDNEDKVKKMREDLKKIFDFLHEVIDRLDQTERC